MGSVWGYALLNAFGVFISSIAQVMLKKSAQTEHDSALGEYLNVRVIVAYAIFFSATFLSVLSYKGIPLSMGPILDATGYLYVTLFGVTIFHEKMTRRRFIALGLIICGIMVYTIGL